MLKCYSDVYPHIPTLIHTFNLFSYRTSTHILASILDLIEWDKYVQQIWKLITLHDMCICKQIYINNRTAHMKLQYTMLRASFTCAHNAISFMNFSVKLFLSIPLHQLVRNLTFKESSANASAHTRARIQNQISYCM